MKNYSPLLLLLPVAWPVQCPVLQPLRDKTLQFIDPSPEPGLKHWRMWSDGTATTPSPLCIVQQSRDVYSGII